VEVYLSHCEDSFDSVSVHIFDVFLVVFFSTHSQNTASEETRMNSKTNLSG
jgi:hypothetical protein